jgi:3-dehydro-L-gulonate 2-dehydrogenase
MQRIPYAELCQLLVSSLLKLGFEPERAEACARMFVETTCDGVYTHGISRFPRFIAMIRNGNISVTASPRLVASFGAMERWDGNRGPGNLNAYSSMERAIELSRNYGLGCVALRNSNHWMRGGTYGWQAADAGMIGICWTNTMPNLPPWGGVKACLGNNPIVFAVPRKNGNVVLDFAMSQFSYGSLASYRVRGEVLPFDGGFDINGNITRDPAAIERTQRPLPVGYWKGSGLALMLDLIVSIVSMGSATHQFSNDPLQESGISQMFIAINPGVLSPVDISTQIADDIVASLHACPSIENGSTVRYPGENTLRIRAQNLLLGIPVEDNLWAELTSEST